MLRRWQGTKQTKFLVVWLSHSSEHQDVDLIILLQYMMQKFTRWLERDKCGMGIGKRESIDTGWSEKAL